MELAEYLRILRKYWVSISAIVVVGVLVTGLYSFVSKPTYTATTQIFVAVPTANTAGDLAQGSTYAENQVQSYAQIAVAPIVLQPVIDQLGLQTTTGLLARKVTATALTKTAIIQVAVVDGDAEESARIADAIGKQLITIVNQLSPAGLNGAKTTQATVIAPAVVPVERTTPKVAQNLGLGLLMGLLVALGQAILRARFDTRIVGEGDIALVTDSSIVGTIEFDPDAGKSGVIVEANAQHPRAESYRRLRTNLQFLALGERSRSVVVTSAVPGEGKTTTAINIASTLAAAGQSVLLIDGDLRRPTIARYLDIDGAAGLTTVLIGHATLSDVVQPIAEGRLHVLCGGQVPPNPSELLGSMEMKRLINEAVAKYDYVIIDSPPLLPVTDSAVLAKEVGGVLVVVGSGGVTRPQLGEALGSLEAVEGTVLGLVLNKVPLDKSGYYRYSYAYRRLAEASDSDTAQPSGASRG